MRGNKKDKLRKCHVTIMFSTGSKINVIPISLIPGITFNPWVCSTGNGYIEGKELENFFRQLETARRGTGVVSGFEYFENVSFLPSCLKVSD